MPKIKLLIIGLFAFQLLGCCMNDHILSQSEVKGNRYAMASSILPNAVFINRDFLNTYAWTINGDLNIVRVFLDFDMSQIPPNSSIKSAKLSLYYNSNSQQWSQGHQGDNGITIERVTSSWQPTTLTWNNQPQVTSLNKVMVGPSQSPTQDYLDMDVTNLINDMISTGNKNGLVLKLQTEAPYRINFWASTDHNDPNKCPKLTFTYN